MLGEKVANTISIVFDFNRLRFKPTTYHIRCEDVLHCIAVSEISLKMVLKTHIPTFKLTSRCNVLLKFNGFVNYKLFSTMPDHSLFHSISQYVSRCALNDCSMSKLIIMNMMTTLHEQPFYFYFTAKSQVYINNFTDCVSIRLIAI